jgi:proteic killer suppression protein
MIKSFAAPETERVFHRQFSRKLPGGIQSVALRKLRMLNNAHGINDRWRVCFTWRNGDAYDVEIVDDH